MRQYRSIITDDIFTANHMIICCHMANRVQWGKMESETGSRNLACILLA